MFTILLACILLWLCRNSRKINLVTYYYMKGDIFNIQIKLCIFNFKLAFRHFKMFVVWCKGSHHEKEPQIRCQRAFRYLLLCVKQIFWSIEVVKHRTCTRMVVSLAYESQKCTIIGTKCTERFKILFILLKDIFKN